MWNATRRVVCRTYPCILQYSHFSSTPKPFSLQNPPLKLDPGLEALLCDVDISLKNSMKGLPKHKELEIVTRVDSGLPHGLSLTEWSSMEINADLDDVERESRKSPAANFGSNQIGSVILPQELQSAIEVIISASQKSLLRSDAKRLFLSAEADSGEEGGWDAHYDTVYRTRNQAARHAVRDGTAFASVALPAHYSAVAAVLHHVKLRIGPSWNIDRIIDWGAGTGSGLWASLYTFQENPDGENEPRATTSSIKSYLAIDKREGLIGIGKRLVNHISTENLDVRWQKCFREEDKLLQEEAKTTVALSAFMLTTLPNPMAQRALVEEMWASGAHTIILIDHDTTEGFKAIAHAREHILETSRLETGDSGINSSCHVLAPCPHDQACPLFRSGEISLICGFSQRLQRPTFLRRTKHSGVGHEDIYYSYVVIRRGPRPDPVTTSVGRIGGIGRHLLEKSKHDLPLKELEIHDECKPTSTISISQELPGVNPEIFDVTGSELQAQLRKEAHRWPRLVFPPLKKSGHIILDACTAEGKIMRMTIPKSQGKQPFYDARKSSWGDIFPHPPKNAPQERHQRVSRKDGESAPSGDDIGKRKELHKRRERASYPDLADNLKERKKLSKKDYTRISHAKVWYDMSDR